jgi:hypothetical protein
MSPGVRDVGKYLDISDAPNESHEGSDPSVVNNQFFDGATIPAPGIFVEAVALWPPISSG